MRKGLLLVAALCGAAPAFAGDLMSAAREGDAAQVVRLARSDDVNRKQADGTTALMWVVRRDDVAGARALLRAGARVDEANVNGVTPLHLACGNGSAAMIGLLLDAGASIEKLDGAGETPLMSAVRSGDVIQFELASPLCADGPPDVKKTTFFFGLAATSPPMHVNATVYAIGDPGFFAVDARVPTHSVPNNPGDP